MSKRKRILDFVVLLASILLAAGKTVRDNEDREDHSRKEPDSTDYDDFVYDSFDDDAA